MKEEVRLKSGKRGKRCTYDTNGAHVRISVLTVENWSTAAGIAGGVVVLLGEPNGMVS